MLKGKDLTCQDLNICIFRGGGTSSYCVHGEKLRKGRFLFLFSRTSASRILQEVQTANQRIYSRKYYLCRPIATFSNQ